MEPLDIADPLDITNRGKYNPLQRPYLFTDFFVSTSNAAVDPFLGATVASGTTNQPNVVDQNHPGVIRLLSSTTTNSGYYIGTNTAQIRLAGGEQVDCIFYMDLLSGSQFRVGFFDSATVAAPTDAVMIEIDGNGVATGKNYANGVTSSTPTTGQLAQATWYRARVKLNAAATEATFTIYNMAGQVVWTATLATNIPTGASRETGAGFIATNVGTSAVTLAHLDFLGIGIARTLARGV